jgi:hypothetical protein
VDFVSLSSEKNEIQKDDLSWVKMIKDFLESNKLYFSDKVDLTLSISKLLNQNGSKTLINKDYSHFTFSNVDEQFCWNTKLMSRLKPLTEIGFMSYPVINGFLGFDTINFEGKELNVGLISRKGSSRSGVKFFKRGVDDYGHTANYVETEQVITYQDENKVNHILSYIQLRGTIPLYWSQCPDLSKTPKVGLFQ